uniref:OBP7 n=1 Tax=Corythucha ciliata TaxID=369451 RepID=A0A3G2YUZ7_CORCT|nr:OBP7 [Corythucha ciliata]
MYKLAVIVVVCQVLVDQQTLAAVTKKKPAPKDVIKSLAQRCAGQFQLPPEKATLAFKDELPQNEDEMCYFQCMYEGVRIINDSAYNKDGAMKYAKVIFEKPEDFEKASKVIQQCDKDIVKKTDGKDKCGLGKSVRDCFVKNGKEVNFFPHS